MSDAPQTSSSRSRSRRVVTACAAALLAGTTLGTTLGGVATPARAQNALQPSGMSQHLPDFVDLAKQVRPAVVSITSMLKDDGSDDEEGGGGQEGGGQQTPFPFPFPFQAPQQNRGSRTVEARGSGFIISADGYIVTNNHVVKNATSVSVTLDDGTTLKAKVVGHDAGTDIALLKVKPSAKLSFIQLGESDDVQPGEWVIAVGNPYGLGGSVTAGIVSARGRDIGDGPYESFIQVDAPINRGNSGGPLITQDGKVVGVNTAILSPGSGGGSIGIGFAIPSDTVKDVVSQLEKTGHVQRGFIGVTAQEITPGMAKALNLPIQGSSPDTAGALVASVQDDSPAEKAGIKPGDVITRLNDQKVGNPRDLAVKVAGVVPNTKVTLTFLRGGATQTAQAMVALKPGAGNGQSAAGQGGTGNTGSIGVSLAALTPDLRQQLGLDEDVKGVVVRDVQGGSAADQAGLKAGDVIVGVGNTLVNSPHQAADAIHASLKNGEVALRVLHDGQMLFVAISPNDNSGAGGEGDNGSEGDGQG